MTFTDYALRPDLSPDEIYTVETLIEDVRSKFDPDYWDDWSGRGDAREATDYQPGYSKDHVRPAEKELSGLSWLSFQRIRDRKRPIRDLSALRFLPRLSELVLINCEVSDILPVVSCKELKVLNLRKNPIRDISGLTGCDNIEVLDLRETCIENFSVLETLSKLRQLSISAGQIPALRKLNRLPALRKLEFGLDTFDSFEKFPELPELRVIQSAHVKRLDGLERFNNLENLVNLSGEFDSLEPLRELKALTHANIINSCVRSLEPLAGLSALRYLVVCTDALNVDLSPLKSLPALHELTVKCDRKEPASLGKLRAALPSWDIEFHAPVPRYTTSLELHVDDDDAFDVCNAGKLFNLTDSDANEGLLSSESDWLDGRMEQVLLADFVKDVDYAISSMWPGARFRLFVLLSDRAVEALPRLAFGIQKVLSESRKDWFICLQSDETKIQFVVWIYSGKIMVAKKYVETVQKLIKSD